MTSIRTFFALVILLFCTTLAQAQTIEKIGAQDLRNIVDSSKGRVLVINYWATWCVPCVKEFPGLVALRRQYPESDLHLVGISVDYNIRPVENFVKQHKVNFPIYLDNGEISEMLSIKSIPRTVIYSRSGEKILDHLGYISEESFLHVVDRARKMP
jgi:thiol-disulfide isomerase/thioredoxin